MSTGIRDLVEFKVLLLPDEVGDKTGKENILYMPDTTKEREQAQSTRGVLVKASGMAFSDWRGGTIPQEGDRVAFVKYAGELFKGNDDKEYRIANDKDILAVLEEG